MIRSRQERENRILKLFTRQFHRSMIFYMGWKNRVWKKNQGISKKNLKFLYIQIFFSGVILGVQFLLRVKSFLHGFLSQLLFLSILELCELFSKKVNHEKKLEKKKSFFEKKTYIVILSILSFLQIVFFRFQSHNCIPQFTGFAPQLVRIQRVHIQRLDPDAQGNLFLLF